ncbi:MAG TPA: poly(3-hydroxybutyrate) depolymerase, partial [Methyloceanibacter sp.]|nr:poly(3-hydroxybutyrate) depolymerase [Methyloceanibacter sp.]
MRQIDLKKVSPLERRDARAFGAVTRRASCLFAVLLPLLCAAAGFLPARSSVAESLPNLGANIKQSSVSGLSSGAFMAVQIEVAHSSDIVGAGIVAGGPFACAESASAQAFPFWPTAVAQNAAQALYRCMKTDWGAPDLAASVKRAKELAVAGDIDPIDDVKDDNVYLFSGNEDATVTRPVVEAAKRFFEEIGVQSGNITLVEKEGGHAFLTEEGGAACGISAAPYVSDCDYDQAKAILSWIYGPLTPPIPGLSGHFIVFNQNDFSGASDGFADEGTVFIPESCATEPGCRIHIVLHGCEQ